MKNAFTEALTEKIRLLLAEGYLLSDRIKRNQKQNKIAEFKKISDALKRRIATLEAEKYAMRGALEFYSDPYKAIYDDEQVPDFYSELDFGARADAALEL